MTDYQRQPQLRGTPPSSISPIGDRELKNVPKILELINFDEKLNSLAGKEAAALAAGTLEEMAAQNAHQRSEAAKGHIHILMMSILYTVFIGMTLMVSVWFFHMISPPSWHFLSDIALGKIETFVFSGAIVTGFKHYFSKHF